MERGIVEHGVMCSKYITYIERNSITQPSIIKGNVLLSSKVFSEYTYQPISKLEISWCASKYGTIESDHVAMIVGIDLFIYKGNNVGTLGEWDADSDL